MDLQTMGDKPVTSENVPSIDNLRAHSPRTADHNRPQPDIPMRLEESWRTASSRRPNARPDLRAHPRPPAVPPRESYGTVVEQLLPQENP